MVLTDLFVSLIGAVTALRAINVDLGLKLLEGDGLLFGGTLGGVNPCWVQ
jgi:hypothetical protein